MSTERNIADVLDTQGAASPPRRNGELVFAAPWESRIFGLTMLLYRAGHFEWDDFRSLLIDEIRGWEAQHPDGHGWSYYERWQAAFEKLLAQKGLCAADELEQRSLMLAARPADH